MKKAYIEPVMIVEDFRVDEMVAANCILVPNDVPVVSQMSKFDPPCPSGFEGNKGVAYANISDKYEGVDHDKDPSTPLVNLFTEGYHGYSDNNQYICGVDPFKEGITFDNDYNCNDTSSTIINS